MINYEYPQHSSPCSFKNVCKECRAVTGTDRPSMCLEMECTDFTPCAHCGANRLLDEYRMCANCRPRSQSGTVAVRDDEGNPVVTTKRVPEVLKLMQKNKADKSDPISTVNDGSIRRGEASLCLPGTPPDSYSAAEKEYYYSQWSEYAGFFRDPTAYAVCHNIILLEIELNFLTSYIATIRDSEMPDAMEKRKTSIINNLETLRKQLPDKEANDMDNDERSFAMTYERYIEVAKTRRVGNVARILSPEAIALAPVLPFKIDPSKILANLGYHQVDIVQAVDLFLAEHMIPESPRALLEFFGFYLSEKYALPYDESLVDEGEDALAELETEEKGSRNDIRSESSEHGEFSGHEGGDGESDDE